MKVDFKVCIHKIFLTLLQDTRPNERLRVKLRIKEQR